MTRLTRHLDMLDHQRRCPLRRTARVCLPLLFDDDN